MKNVVFLNQYKPPGDVEHLKKLYEEHGKDRKQETNQKKVFVRVEATYAAKNKLCKELINELATYNGYLFKSETSAKKALTSHFLAISQGYSSAGGKAQLPKLTEWQTGTGFGFMIENTITLIGDEVRVEE